MYNKKSKIELKKSLDRESFNRITCSFYKYCSIKSPEDFRNELYTNLENYNILGRIYVSYEGINAQIKKRPKTFKNGKTKQIFFSRYLQ